MSSGTTRRAALATIGTGIAGVAALGFAAPKAALAAMSSAAGVFGGGSLEGPNGTVQFSAFATRLEFDDQQEAEIRGAFEWFDPAGLDGEPLTLELATLSEYRRTDHDTTRFMAGTVLVNGEDEEPFGLFLTDNGVIGATTDNLQLAVGTVAAGLGTVPVEAGSNFSYEVSANLSTGNIQLINFTQAQ